MNEIIAVSLTGIFGLLTWWLNDKRVKLKHDLEIENLKLENDKLKKENEDVKVKFQFLDRVLDLPFINAISDAVDNIFNETKADRFLILIAKNGKEDFNVVNVVYEQHKNKEFRINCIVRYRNVIIDSVYRDMLKRAEFRGVVEMETKTMPESILKTFYEIEGVKYSKVRHLARKPIDDHNDILIYSSLSTHVDEPFTEHELATAKVNYEGIIKPALEQIID